MIVFAISIHEMLIKYFFMIYPSIFILLEVK